MSVKLADIVEIMETLIAPSWLAEKWDNVGLQIGQKDRLVQKVWVALDPLPEVVAQACKAEVDLLITHHPLIFRPIKSIDFNTPLGELLYMSMKKQLAIFSAHTNLDSVKGGLNDILASKIGLRHLKVLNSVIEQAMYKLVIYAPLEYEEKIIDALFETPAGKIGKYSCCSFRSQGKGTFKPEDSAKPFKGEISNISHVNEIRIESLVPESKLSQVIEHIKKHHPYETMAYDVYPLLASETGQGIGRVGSLETPIKLADLALKIKDSLSLNSVKIAGRTDLPIHKAAICTGSGSSLMKAFFSSDAQVYISGDLRYHDARDVEALGRGLIDIGHFASEHLIVDALVRRLQYIFNDREMDVTIEPSLFETDPFSIL